MARAKEQLSVTGGQPYEQDFALWLEEQVELLRSGTFDRLDLENLIDELESMGRSDRRSVSSDLVVLLQHLLKHQFQPKRRSRSCLVTIEEHRQRLEEFRGKSESSPLCRSALSEGVREGAAAGDRRDRDCS